MTNFLDGPAADGDGRRPDGMPCAPPRRGKPAELPGFAARCRIHRERLGYSLGEAAREAALSRTYVWELEQGIVSPSADTLRRMANVYECSMDQLWRGFDAEHRD